MDVLNLYGYLKVCGCDKSSAMRIKIKCAKKMNINVMKIIKLTVRCHEH